MGTSTRQKRSELLLRLQYDITRRLIESAAAADGARAALQAVCEAEGWDCGELWRLDEATGVMRRFAYWALPGEGEAFSALSTNVEFHPGEGLVGAAWQAARPLWIEDAAADTRTARRAASAQTGLRGVLLCPVTTGARVVAVLAFTCARIRSPDEALLQALTALSTQVALFLERSEAQAHLRESEEHFRRTFELAGSGLALIDMEGRYLRVNRRACEILGYEEHELLQRSVKSISHPEDRDLTDDERARLHQGAAESVTFEKRYVRKDGSSVWVSLVVAVERDASGAPLHEITVLEDISARKAAEAALRDSEERFRSLTNLSSDWFWELDADYRFTRLEGRRVAGDDPELRARLVGTRRWDSGLQVEGGWAAHRALLDARQPFHDLLMWRTMSDGSARYVAVSGEPMFAPDGRFAGYRGVGRDVTEEKRAESILRLEHQVAGALSQAADAPAGIGAVIRLVCESQQWACGRYFRVDAARGVLVCEDGWSSPAVPRFQAFLTESRGLQFALGEGLTGLAWQCGKPLWSTDLANDERFVPKNRAASLARGAFVFPVHVEGETIGVVTFLSEAVRPPDERLLQAARMIGHQLGSFLRRMEAEDNMRRFRLAMDSSGDMILLVDRATLRYVDVNATACQRLGYSREELLAMGPHDIAPASRETFAREYDALIAEPSRIGIMNAEYRCKDGSLLPFESTRRVLLSGGRLVIVAIARDIRERLAAEEALRESEARFRALTEMSSDFFWETDPQHRFTSVVHGPNYSQDLGRILGRVVWDLPYIHPDEAGWARLRATMDQHRSFRDFELGQPWRDGSVRYFAVSGEPHFAAGERFVGYRGVGRDITEVMLARERIASLAFQDALTGLANRAGLAPALEQAIERTRRRGSRLAGLFIDLDGFKEINDAHGHDAGDRLLIEAARRLRGALRAGDPVARLGGDEFFVVLEDLHDAMPAERVARKLLETVQAPYDLGNGRQARVSASIGVSLYPDDAGDGSTLIKHADTAMYAAKQAGKNDFRMYSARPAANDAAADTSADAGPG